MKLKKLLLLTTILGLIVNLSTPAFAFVQKVEQMKTAGSSGTAPVSNGSTALAMTDIATQAELNTHAALTATHGVSGAIVGTTDTQTLTNKTVTLRVVVIADATSVTMNADATDVATQANTQSGGTLTMNAPSGTPVNGQLLEFRIVSTNAQTYSWNAIFRGSSDAALPTVSTASKYDYILFQYNSTSAKWDCLASNKGF